MNHLLEDELDRDTDQSESGDREISLGAGTILAIFFGLALLCGCVFALGYSMGRRSAESAPAPVIIGNGSAPALNSASKPAAGYTAPAPTLVDDSDAAATEPATAAKAGAADGLIASDKISSNSGTAPAAALPAPESPGSFMVQVAAVSTQDIANIELAALRKFNYPVVVRHETTDQLLHIQIGPFGTKKEAEAMRQDVLSHGFNAIVKQ